MSRGAKLRSRKFIPLWIFLGGLAAGGLLYWYFLLAPIGIEREMTTPVEVGEEYARQVEEKVENLMEALKEAGREIAAPRETQAASEELPAVLSVERGRAEITRGGERIEIEGEGKVLPGGKIRTSPDTRAFLYFFEGSVVVLEGESEIEIVKSERIMRGIVFDAIIRLKVELGKLIAHVHRLPTPGSEFLVETPSAVFEAEGTCFEIRAGGDGAVECRVFEGRVDAAALTTGERGEPLCALLRLESEGRNFLSIPPPSAELRESARKAREALNKASQILERAEPGRAFPSVEGAKLLTGDPGAGTAIYDLAPTLGVVAPASSPHIPEGLCSLEDPVLEGTGARLAVLHIRKEELPPPPQVPKPGLRPREWAGPSIGRPPLKSFTLKVKVDPPGAGRVERDFWSPYYIEGEKVTLEAIPAGPKFVFSHWSGDLSGTSPRKTVIMNSDKVIIAHFREVQVYRLHVEVVPPEAGWVERSSWDPYLPGQEVRLVAKSRDPNRFVFERWEGDLKGADPHALLVMNSDKTVVARFRSIKPVEERRYRLRIEIDPPHAGRVYRSTLGPYSPGEEVVLLAVSASPDYAFERWEGDASGTSPEITITMNEDKMVKACFKERVFYSLDIEIDPPEGGWVEPFYGERKIEEGRRVFLKAVPCPDFEFLEWRGDIRGRDPQLTFTMNSDKHLKACFVRKSTLLVITPSEASSKASELIGTEAFAFPPEIEVTGIKINFKEENGEAKVLGVMNVVYKHEALKIKVGWKIGLVLEGDTVKWRMEELELGNLPEAAQREVRRQIPSSGSLKARDLFGPLPARIRAIYIRDGNLCVEFAPS